MATFRRQGAKLLSIGDGHGNLVMAISQFKELRNATKAVISAQNDTIEDLIKWSAQDTKNNDNSAIQDIVEKFGEVFAMWIETQRQFANDLKEVRRHFEIILEDTTNNQEVPPLNSSTASFLQQHEEHQEEQQHDQHQRQQPHQDDVVDHPHTAPNGFQNTTSVSPQQQQASLPNVKEEEDCSKSDIDIDLDEITPCGSPKQKNSSRRNKWGNLSYADLITQAIKSSPEQRLTLSQIYDWVVTNVPYFSDKGDSASSSGWKNSIRHNLSLHSRFKRIQNEGQGKSSWWMMNPEAVKHLAGNSNSNGVGGGVGVGGMASASKHCHHYQIHRKRSNTLESGLIEKRRASHVKRRDSSGSVRSLTSGNRRDLQRTASSGSLSYPESPEFTMRPRALSNASSCGGRLSPAMSSVPPRPRPLSNASSTATLEVGGGNGGGVIAGPPPANTTAPNYPTCQSPIFNYIEKLRLDDSLNDDLEDINNLIDTEVGVENLQQNQYVEDPATAAGLMVSSFRPQESSSTKVKILEPRFKQNTQPIPSEHQVDIATTATTTTTTGRTEILKLRHHEQFWNQDTTNLNFPPFLSQQQQPIAVQQNTQHHPHVNSKEDSLLEELLNLTTTNHDSNYQHSTPTTLSLTSM